MTGRPIFLEKCAGMTMLGNAWAFDPKPPPQYSATKTMSWGGTSMSRASSGIRKLWLCDEPWMWHLPFSQNAKALRGSML
jgi:hypothetical protein